MQLFRCFLGGFRLGLAGSALARSWCVLGSRSFLCGFITRRIDRRGQDRCVEARRGIGIVTNVVTGGTAIVAAGTQTASAAVFAHEGVFRRLVNLTALIFRDAGSICLIVAFGSGLLRSDTRFAVFAGPILTGSALRPLRTIFTLGTIFARGTFLAGGTLFTRCTLFTRAIFAAVVDWLIEGGKIADRSVIARILGIFLAAFLPAFLAGRALFFLADALVSDHAEIMVGELQEVFRLHPVTVKVGIRSQLAILLKHLRRIAARPAVNPVELLATTATTAAAVVRAIAAAAPAVIVVPTSIVQG